MRKALSNGSVGKFENPLRMHALLRSMQRNGELIFAASAAEEICSASAGDWSQCRSRFTTNPATGTLEIPLDLRLKARKALRAEVRRPQVEPLFEPCAPLSFEVPTQVPWRSEECRWRPSSRPGLDISSLRLSLFTPPAFQRFHDDTSESHDTCWHSWRQSVRFVKPAKAIVHEVQRGAWAWFIDPL